MDAHWNYMIEVLMKEHITDMVDEDRQTDASSLYVEQVLLPKEAAITYHAKK